MSLLKKLESTTLAARGQDLHAFAAELYPICRSITGEGLRKTLSKIQERVPLEISEVPSGTKVLDWIVPREWNIRDAYIADQKGNRVVDFQNHSLHVLNYSTPVRARMSLTELRQHLFTIPEHPDWIPYRTSYYKENWGFCLSHNQLLAMQDSEYEVCIDSTLENGHLTYGECYLPGKCEDEVLISCHVCHPSLANDNLSGVTVATALASLLAKQENRYSYRFLFVPGTIGAIAWLARNRDNVRKIRHGLVLAGIGDAGNFHYKKSRRGDAEIDQAMQTALRDLGVEHEMLDFSPYGYDERQYCSPGFNLPVGCLMRSVWGTFPEYHTSADNLDFIRPESLAGSLRLCANVVDILENNRTYVNESPFGEPQLGRRNLYRTVGGESVGPDIQACLWVLNFSDGEHSLLDIARRSGLAFTVLAEAAQQLKECGLLSEVPELTSRPQPQAKPW